MAAREYEQYEASRANLLALRTQLRRELEDLKQRADALEQLQREVHVARRKFNESHDTLVKALYADVAGINGTKDEVSAAADAAEEAAQ